MATRGAVDLQLEVLPEQWVFGVLDPKAASGVDRGRLWWAAIWGYQQLVRDPMHLDGLVDMDQDALGIFYLELARSLRVPLSELIEAHVPQMLDYVPLIGERALSDRERVMLVDALGQELDARGLYRGVEPDDETRLLNDLFDYLPYL